MMIPEEYDTFSSNHNFIGCSVGKSQTSWILALIQYGLLGS
jgi:hypothetical protein